MEKLKHYFLLMLLSLCSMASYAYDFEVDGLYYNLLSASEKTCELVGCSELTTVLDVPATVQMKNVVLSVTQMDNTGFVQKKSLTDVNFSNSLLTSIPSNVFNGCTNITSVELSSRITQIGEKAFCGCPISNLIIPTNVLHIGKDSFDKLIALTIEDGDAKLSIQGTFPLIERAYIGRPIEGACFQTTSIKSVEFGNKITSVEDKMFYACYDLSSVQLGDNITTIGNSAFKSCISLSSVSTSSQSASNVVNLSNIKIIKASAFYRTALPSVHFDKIETIESNAFEGCKFSEVVFPTSTISIGNGAFSNVQNAKFLDFDIPIKVDTPFSSLETLYLGRNVSGNLVGKSPINNVEFGEGITEISAQMFENAVGINYLTLPHNINKIGRSAFRGCTGLKRITTRAQFIDNSAFEGCENLIIADIEGISILGSNAFAHCDKLEWMSMGDAVEAIENNAFLEDAALKSISCLSPIPPTCQSETFSGVNKWDCTIYVNIDKTKDFTNKDFWKDFLFYEEVPMPDYLTSLPKPSSLAYVKSVELSSTTMLSDVISESEREKITKLSIKGPICGSDIIYINKMPLLEDLDLSLCYVVGGGDYYYSSGSCYWFTDFRGYTWKSVKVGSNSVTGVFNQRLECARFNSNIKSLKLPIILKVIGDELVMGDNLQSLYINNSIPPQACNSNRAPSACFVNTNLNTCTVYVPKGSKEKYLSSAFWRSFTNIEEYNYNDINRIVHQPTENNMYVKMSNPEEPVDYQWYKFKETLGADVALGTILCSENGWIEENNVWRTLEKPASSYASLEGNFEFNKGDILSFDWSIESEESFDQLQCYLGEKLLFAVSGKQSGTFSQQIDAVTGILKFIYVKDSSISSSGDCAKIWNILVNNSNNCIRRIVVPIESANKPSLTRDLYSKGDEVFCEVTKANGEKLRSNIIEINSTEPLCPVLNVLTSKTSLKFLFDEEPCITFGEKQMYLSSCHGDYTWEIGDVEYWCFDESVEPSSIEEIRFKKDESIHIKVNHGEIFVSNATPNSALILSSVEGKTISSAYTDEHGCGILRYNKAGIMVIHCNGQSIKFHQL